MWASQLLTIQSNDISTHQIICQLGRPADFGGVNTVEVVLFNCPEWGISVQTISVLLGQVRLDPPPGDNTYHDVSNKNITLTSCTSLVRVCVPVNTLLTLIALQFLPAPDSHWVHLAEVRFNGRDSTCLPDAVLNQTALPPETHTNFPQHSFPPEGTPSTTLHHRGAGSKLGVGGLNGKRHGHVSQSKLDVHRTHTPRCEVKKIIALWRMHAVMQGWKEVGCED